MSLRAHESYGQHGLTPVDRLGVWLSQRAIRRHLPSRNDLEVLELGCGYRALQPIALKSRMKRGIGLDFKIVPELQTLEKFTLQLPGRDQHNKRNWSQPRLIAFQSAYITSCEDH